MLKNKLYKDKTNIAIIGAGISGLTAAMLLSKRYNVCLYEANNYLGGHALTLNKKISYKNRIKNINFDVGFLVYNNRNYPLFSNILSKLKVKTINSNMSFSVSNKMKNFEYGSTGILSSTNNLKNIFNINFWSMIKEIKRFFVVSNKIINSKKSYNNISVKQFIGIHNFNNSFVFDHFLPMCGAIWSISNKKVMDMPIKTILIFFHNHGLLSFFNKPIWKTIDGGSKNYVNAITKEIKGKILLNEKVMKVRRNKENITLIFKNHKKTFDKVILAIHSDEILNILEKPTEIENKIFSKCKYEANKIYIHQDQKLMPSSKSTWSSWNVIQSYTKNKAKNTLNNNICVTYWINKLQNIYTDIPLLVTLNAKNENIPDKNKILKIIKFKHPIFNSENLNISTEISSIQSKNNTFYIGAWLGYGFHEDGVKSAVNLKNFFEVDYNLYEKI